MNGSDPKTELRDGAKCRVVGGTRAGKSGYVTITVVQPNGVRLKTLAKNVVIEA